MLTVSFAAGSIFVPPAAAAFAATIAGRSFNGRTAGSGPAYRGSTPCLPAISLPPRKLTYTKERPHLARRIDAAGVRSDKPLRQRTAARPGMSTFLHDVEHDGRVFGTVRVFAARDIRRHCPLEWIGFAAVSSRPVRGP